MMQRRQVVLIRALLVALSAVPVVAGGQNTRVQRGVAVRQRIDSTFAFSRSGELYVSVGGGEVRVTAWARSDARVQANSEAGTIAMNASPERIRIEVRPGMGGRARFDINVPIGVRVVTTTHTATIDVSGTQSDLTLTTVSGRISASDGAGHSRITAAAGRVTLQRFTGETRVGTMTGPLNISEIAGDLSITTISAPTSIERADLANFEVDAAQGNLEFSGRLSPQGKHRIETFGGNVNLRFPADFAATISMQSLHGNLHAVDFPVTLTPSQRYTINGGGTPITISTLNGGVFLRKLDASNRR